jgi:hypothetical protein
MWTSTNFKTYKKQFDFSSSEQGTATYTALKIEDIDFINMIEALEGEIEEDQIFQTIICDQCGIYHCSQGNWVAVRQIDNFIFFIPAFDELEGEQDRTEYDPPYSFKQRGAYWLPIEDYNNFKKLVPELDKLKSINRVAKFELVALYKWDTPHKMFGDFPNFQSLRKNHVLAVSDLDKEIALEILDRKLKELETLDHFHLIPLTENDKVISVFLDDSSTTEWNALSKTEDDYNLLLGGTFKIITK